MEEFEQLYIGPEESEIFFDDVTEKEIQLRNKLELETHESNPEGPNNVCGNAEGTLTLESEHDLNVIKADFDRVDNHKIHSFALSRDQKKFGSSAVSVIGSTDVGNQLQIRDEENNERVEIFQPQSIQTTLEKKLGGKNCITAQNPINLFTDNNASNILKNVIDRGILETSKGVVRADKDGGFLKVLSEIALIKAEADENTLRDTITLYDIPCEEKLNDDNKENKQNGSDMVNAINVITEVPSSKVQHGASMEKLSDDICIKGTNNSPEKLSMKELESVNQKKFECGSSIIIKNCESGHNEIMALSSAKEKINGPSNLEVELNDHVVKDKGILKAVTDKTELLQTYNSQNKNLHEVTNLEENVILDKNHDFTKVIVQEITENSIPELILSIDSSEIKTEEKEECSVTLTNDREANKKLLKRNTILLLEELNELVISDQTRRASPDTRNNTKLSEEVAKVIQKLKSIGLDDSVCLSDQYFDIDKLNGSFFSTEVTNTLNDTLSKPLNSLTQADIELLLEKMSLNPLDNEPESTKSQSKNNKILSILKENDNFENLNKGLDLLLDQREKLGNQTLVSPCKILKNEMSVKSSKNKKVTSKQGNTCEDKKPTPRPGIKSQANNFLSKGNLTCQSADKDVKTNCLTRIPKLTSTTSKVPISGKEVGTQIKKPMLIKTPLLKTQESSRYNKIESPVRAYINSKVPVSKCVSSVKPKSEVGTNHRTLPAKSSETKNQDMKKVFRKNETRLNMPSTKSTNVFLTKVNGVPESRLPKFTSRVQKGLLKKCQ